MDSYCSYQNFSLSAIIFGISVSQLLCRPSQGAALSFSCIFAQERCKISQPCFVIRGDWIRVVLLLCFAVIVFSRFKSVVCLFNLSAILHFSVWTHWTGCCSICCCLESCWNWCFLWILQSHCRSCWWLTVTVAVVCEMFSHIEFENAIFSLCIVIANTFAEERPTTST